LDAWWVVSALIFECHWASILSNTGERTPPGFGSSDCACSGHLIYFQNEKEIAKAWETLREWSKYNIQRSGFATRTIGIRGEINGITN
jgi:Uri superfamily endonuclease